MLQDVKHLLQDVKHLSQDDKHLSQDDKHLSQDDKQCHRITSIVTCHSTESAFLKISSTCNRMSSICHRMTYKFHRMKSICHKIICTCYRMSSICQRMTSIFHRIKRICHKIIWTCSRMSSTIYQPLDFYIYVCSILNCSFFFILNALTFSSRQIKCSPAAYTLVNTLKCQQNIVLLFTINGTKKFKRKRRDLDINIPI